MACLRAAEPVDCAPISLICLSLLHAASQEPRPASFLARRAPQGSKLRHGSSSFTAHELNSAPSGVATKAALEVLARGSDPGSAEELLAGSLVQQVRAGLLRPASRLRLTHTPRSASRNQAHACTRSLFADCCGGARAGRTASGQRMRHLGVSLQHNRSAGNCYR
jgi:hypothetical protein